MTGMELIVVNLRPTPWDLGLGAGIRSEEEAGQIRQIICGQPTELSLLPVIIIT